MLLSIYFANIILYWEEQHNFFLLIFINVTSEMNHKSLIVTTLLFLKTPLNIHIKSIFVTISSTVRDNIFFFLNIFVNKYPGQ